MIQPELSGPPRVTADRPPLGDFGMGAWGRHRRAGTAALVLLLGFVATRTAGAAEPSDRPGREAAARLLAEAGAAEKAGDWEAAFSAYCRLYVADRSVPDIRDRLNRHAEFEPLAVADVQETVEAIRNDEVRFDCATGAQDVPAEPSGRSSCG